MKIEDKPKKKISERTSTEINDLGFDMMVLRRKRTHHFQIEKENRITQSIDMTR